MQQGWTAIGVTLPDGKVNNLHPHQQAFDPFMSNAMLQASLQKFPFPNSGLCASSSTPFKFMFKDNPANPWPCVSDLQPFLKGPHGHFQSLNPPGFLWACDDCWLVCSSEQGTSTQGGPERKALSFSLRSASETIRLAARQHERSKACSQPRAIDGAKRPVRWNC